MKYDTLIFDLDGTLLDTIEDLRDAANHVLRRYGLPQRTLPEVRSFVGNGIRNLMTRCVYEPFSEGNTGCAYGGTQEKGVNTGANVGAQLFEEMFDGFRAFYNDNMMNKTRPYDGIYAALDSLKMKGYKLAVLSNKHDAAVKELCSHYFRAYMEAACGSQEGVRSKPEADGVFRIVGLIGSELKRTVYVGDSEVDVMTANNAGIPCISCLWGFRSRDILLKAGADMLAERPYDIVNIIDGLQMDRSGA